jgi:hypothetical protein
MRFTAALVPADRWANIQTCLIQWSWRARALPGDNGVVVISLLGVKPNGKDEHSFYSFFSRGQSLQDWLGQRNAGRKIHIVEHPTTDGTPYPKRCFLQ